MTRAGNTPAVTPLVRHVDIPDYPAPHSPYSHAVVANGFVFVSGQIPVRPGGGPTDVVGDTMQEQTRQALRNVQTILKAAGSSLDRVVKVTVLLARPDLFQEMNEAYAEFFTEAKPARSMVRFGSPAISNGSTVVAIGLAADAVAVKPVSAVSSLVNREKSREIPQKIELRPLRPP